MSDIDKKVVKTTVYKAGYQVKDELWTHYSNDEATPMKSAYTPSGEYIGNPKFAKYLSKRGITPQLRTPESNVCSIGYSPQERKWYGWSHRAIYGFGIGSKITENSTIAERWAGTTVTTLEEAKQVASDFAESVS